MPETIRCPSCDAALRVPEAVLGKKVKCPKCQTAFLAVAPEPEQPQTDAIVSEPAKPPRRKKLALDEPDDRDSSPLEDEDRPRRRRRRKSAYRSAEAENAVTAPAICLMVLGALDVVLMLLDFLLRLLHISVLAIGDRGHAGAGNNAESTAEVVVGMIATVVGLAFAVLIFYGGNRMKQLNNYGLAMTASILALLPCGNCCILGLPLGIWAIVVLTRSEVKQAFYS